MVDYEKYLEASKVNKLRETNELLDGTIFGAVDDIEPTFALLIDGNIDVLLDDKKDADLVCAQLDSEGFTGRVKIRRLWKVVKDNVEKHEIDPKCCGAPFMVNGELQVEELGN